MAKVMCELQRAKEEKIKLLRRFNGESVQELKKDYLVLLIHLKSMSALNKDVFREEIEKAAACLKNFKQDYFDNIKIEDVISLMKSDRLQDTCKIAIDINLSLFDIDRNINEFELCIESPISMSDHFIVCREYSQNIVNLVVELSGHSSNF